MTPWRAKTYVLLLSVLCVGDPAEFTAPRPVLWYVYGQLRAGPQSSFTLPTTTPGTYEITARCDSQSAATAPLKVCVRNQVTHQQEKALYVISERRVPSQATYFCIPLGMQSLHTGETGLTDDFVSPYFTPYFDCDRKKWRVEVFQIDVTITWWAGIPPKACQGAYACQKHLP
jgi:hypothetical protein